MAALTPFEPTPRPWRWRAGAALLILAAAAGRVFYLTTPAAPDLAPDEAHYWDWSRHLDWSYYSKGPLVAWLIRASCELFGNSVLAVRLPAVACNALLLTSMYVLAVRVFRSDRFAFATVAALLTIPVFNVGGLLMTIDAPFTCCWGWALVFGHIAIVSRKPWAWAAAGLTVALGILAKYTMILWPASAFLFLLTVPALRPLLKKPGFWVMCGIGALGGVPILWWNAANDWVTFAHVGTQAGVAGQSGVKWLGPFGYLGGQFALLGLWLFGWVAAVIQTRRATDVGVAYLWWTSVPTFLLFFAFSLTTNVQLNWPITAYLSGALLTVAWVGTMIGALVGRRRRALIAATTLSCVIGLGISTFVYDVRPTRPLMAMLAGEPTPEQPLPLRRLDPTCRLRGWNHLAGEIDACRAELGRRGIEPVIAANRWVVPGELGFYCDGHPEVFSLGTFLGDRHSQYDLWRPNPLADPNRFRGRTFIYIGGDEILLVKMAFENIEEGRHVVYSEAGDGEEYPLAQWKYWVCHGFRGWPELPKNLAGKAGY